MKLKTLVIVVALLAALSAVVFLLRRPAPPATADVRVGRSLTGGFALESAAKLELSDQGKTVTLVRPADGGWRVSNYYDLPADFAKLSAFVNNLAEAKIQRVVTASPERVARLGFGETKVSFRDAADHELWAVEVGRTPDTGGGRYVRFGGEPKAFLADFNAWLDADAKNWADSQLLNLKPEEIAAVDMVLPDGASRAVKRATKESPWTSDQVPAGQQVSVTKVNAVLSSTAAIRFSDTTEPGSAAAEAAKLHQRTFKLTTFDGRHYTVALGRTPEEKKPKTPAGPPPTPEVTAGPPRPTVPGIASATSAPPGEAAKVDAPQFETIPAGPVFVSIRSDDPKAAVNALMDKRAFQMVDYTFASLPQRPDELLEPAPTPPPGPPVSPVSNSAPAAPDADPKTP